MLEGLEKYGAKRRGRIPSPGEIAAMFGLPLGVVAYVLFRYGGVEGLQALYYLGPICLVGSFAALLIRMSRGEDEL